MNWVSGGAVFLSTAAWMVPMTLWGSSLLICSWVHVGCHLQTSAAGLWLLEMGPALGSSAAEWV